MCEKTKNHRLSKRNSFKFQGAKYVGTKIRVQKYNECGSKGNCSAMGDVRTCMFRR